MDIMAPGNPAMRWLRLIRPQDVVWLLLFLLMAIMSEADRQGPSLYVMLAGLAAVQVLETKIPAMGSLQGRVGALIIKFALCWLLIGYTHGLDSRYWLVLLLPVLSAATTFGIFGTLAVALLANLAYLSFLTFVDLPNWDIDVQELVWRTIFLTLAGNLVNMLAADLRTQTRVARRSAEHLTAANRQ